MAADTTQIQRNNNLTDYYNKQLHCLNDHSTQEACKDLVTKKVELEYIAACHDSKCGFLGVTLKWLMDHLKAENPAELEDIKKMKKKLYKKWNPNNNNIEKLFHGIIDLLTQLAEREGKVTYTNAQFIEYTYVAIKETRQFTSSCKKQKVKPSADCSNEAQFQTFF